MRIPQSMTTEVAPSRKTAGARRFRWLRLVYSQGEEPKGSDSRWSMKTTKTIIGRDPGKGGIALNDSKASRLHAELAYSHKEDAFKVVDRESRNGTFVNGQKIEAHVLQNNDVIRIGNSMFVYSDAMIPEGLSISEEQEDVALARVFAEAAAELAAPTELPILIIGPTGAGKEVMAQRIHRSSGRKGAIVAVNCATLSQELIGSELFGHKKGAFSGAQSDRSGLFVEADGGTLFLDEIAELPLSQQPALLRALQEGKVRPVGSDKEVDVQVRVVAATHQPLEALQEKGAFRSDLYARLAGFVIDLPGLKERRDEVIGLFRSFLQIGDKPLAPETAEALLLYGWPQNVRELKHAAERARLFVQNQPLVELVALPNNVQAAVDAESAPTPQPSVRAPAADESEPLTKEELIEALKKHGGNVAQVARAAGKHRQQVYRWLKRHKIDAAVYRPEALDSDGSTPESSEPTGALDPADSADLTGPIDS